MNETQQSNQNLSTQTLTTEAFTAQTKALIDDLKSVCANYGLGNDGNEFKIITQVFLYKFLNDKFIHQIKQLDNNIKNADNWEEALTAYSAEDYEMLTMQLSESTAVIRPDHFISSLFAKQNQPIDKKRENIFKEKQKLTELRDWLLPMLMNGQVTVKNSKKQSN